MRVYFLCISGYGRKEPAAAAYIMRNNKRGRTCDPLNALFVRGLLCLLTCGCSRSLEDKNETVFLRIE